MTRSMRQPRKDELREQLVLAAKEIERLREEIDLLSDCTWQQALKPWAIMAVYFTLPAMTYLLVRWGFR